MDVAEKKIQEAEKTGADALSSYCGFPSFFCAVLCGFFS
jgi:hypothetical protein